MDSGPDTIEEFGKNLASFVSGFLSGVIRHVVRECMREARGSDPRWAIDFTPPTDPEYVLGDANRHIAQDDHLEELRDPDGLGHPILDVSRSIPLPEHPYGKQGTELGKVQHKLDVAQGMLRQDVGQVKAMLEGLKERMRVYEREQERLGYKDIEMLQKRDGRKPYVLARGADGSPRIERARAEFSAMTAGDARNYMKRFIGQS